MGMHGIRVEMQEIRVGMRGIGLGMRIIEKKKKLELS